MPPSLPILTVVAGLIQHANTLLICQRRRGDAFEFKWEFPGGKVEPGETHAEGLCRELREELGIDADIGAQCYRTRHCYPGTYIVELIFYDVLTFRGTPQNHAFEQIRWVDPVILPTFDFLEGDAEFIRWLSQNDVPPS